MEKWIEERLIETIGLERYKHSLGVMNTAIGLAEIYGVDIEKARKAGLLHDCAKFKDQINLLKMAHDFDIILDSVMEHNTGLLHGPIGAKIAEIEYNIRDKEILDAICYHTTGRERMTVLDKIIYIADYIEPGRSFKGVNEVRKLACENLDKSILLAMDNTIKFVIDKGQLIHLDTIKSRNYLKIRLKLE